MKNPFPSVPANTMLTYRQAERFTFKDRALKYLGYADIVMGFKTAYEIGYRDGSHNRDRLYTRESLAHGYWLGRHVAAYDHPMEG